MNVGTFLFFGLTLIKRALIHFRTGRRSSGSCNIEFILTAFAFNRQYHENYRLRQISRFQIVSNVGDLLSKPCDCVSFAVLKSRHFGVVRTHVEASEPTTMTYSRRSLVLRTMTLQTFMFS
jgi:hypothetical protein